MRAVIKSLIICSALSLTIAVNAQTLNCNPDTNGEEWIAGGLPQITPEILKQMEAIPELVLNSKSISTTLPSKVDNSQKPWFRPVFNQKGNCCGQASGIGYTFTYEVNRVRNLNANISEHQYPTHFTWNFLNEEYDGGGSWYFDGWEIIKQMGIPTVEDYGGMYMPNTSHESTIWMTGSDNYYNALSNKVVEEYYSINVSTPAGLNTLKHWLNDHGNGEDTGGLANFAANAYTPEYNLLPSDSDDPGKMIVLRFGTGGYHAWTIVGYNDDVKYDFNGDGEYSNPTNNMAAWEIGALKVVNSWGQNYCDSGYVYVPYRLLATSSFGINPKIVHVLSVTDHYEPELTMKMNVQHPCRRRLNFFADNDANIYPYEPLNKTKSSMYENIGMIGIPNNNVPIELCLDFGQFYNLNDFEKGSFIIKEDDIFNDYNGCISNFSIVDYRWNEVFELPYSIINDVPIENNDSTILDIPYHLIPFDEPIVSDLELNTNRVARRTIIVENNAEFSINEDVRIDMYGTDSYDCILRIGNGSTLTIADNAVITAKRGNCLIEVLGDIVIGDNVTFNTENGATLKVWINNHQNFSVENCNFLGSSLLLDNSLSDIAISTPSGPSATVSNCKFIASNDCDYALKIINYSQFDVSDNTINGKGFNGNRYFDDGLLIFNSGMSNINSIIYNNSIDGCTYTGLTLFGSVSDVRNNNITGCGTGVKLLNGSTVNKFMGSCDAQLSSQTQYIHDNDNNGVYVHKGSMPQTFRFNCITNSVTSGKFFTYEDYNADGKSLNLRIDLENNNWGNYSNSQIANRFQYITNTNNVATFDFLPKWDFGACLSNNEELSIRLSNDADSLWEAGSYSMAKQGYREIVTLYPNTNSANNALKKLLVIEGASGQDYFSLQQYYDNDTTIHGNENLDALAGLLSNKCDELMEQYDEAIAWYESIIENGSTSYNDSVFAVIDLGYLYLRMGVTGDGTRGKSDRYVPKSAVAFAEKVDNLLHHLTTASQGLTHSKDLPEQYWVDIVTEQPDGYVVDDNGDVHIYSAEALAWLSSVSNGLNGQQADDFEGKMVTLEANVDMSAAIWTSIAQGEYGDTTPDRLRFSGTLDGNGFVISGITLYKKDQKSNSFLGTLEGARIEDVVLRHAYAEESNANDGKLFISADFVEGPRTTVIDRCFVEFDEIVKDAIFRDNTALFGYYNNGIIRNCMAVLHKADIYSDKGFLNDNLSLFVWDNKGTIENCASIADSVHWGYHYFLTGIAENNYASGTIENCYSFIDDLFNYEEMPFEQIPRAGICWENYGQIKNCYYNMWPDTDEHWDECHSFADSPVNASYGGEITEAASFMPTPYFQQPYWVLNNSVNITSPSGFIYSTDELQQALFYWVLGRQETGQYLWWCADESFFPNNLPSLCEIDINSIQEESTLKSCPVYPNPADDVFRIDGIVPDETLIYNALGQLVKSVNATNEVSVSDLPAGVYLLRITDNDGNTITSRLSISR